MGNMSITIQLYSCIHFKNRLKNCTICQYSTKTSSFRTSLITGSSGSFSPVTVPSLEDILLLFLGDDQNRCSTDNWTLLCPNLLINSTSDRRPPDLMLFLHSFYLCSVTNSEVPFFLLLSVFHTSHHSQQRVHRSKPKQNCVFYPGKDSEKHTKIL